MSKLYQLLLVIGSSKFNYNKGFSNRDITISYLYKNAPLNFFNELSMVKVNIFVMVKFLNQQRLDIIKNYYRNDDATSH